MGHPALISAFLACLEQEPGALLGQIGPVVQYTARGVVSSIVDDPLRLQDWLQKKGVGDVTLADMATYAGLEERTFLRRFRKATEFNPTEYCQRLRIGKAREMLELTGRTIDQVAWDVGYQDAGSFRKVFKKVIGLKPGDYRKRFGVTQSTAIQGHQRQI